MKDRTHAVALAFVLGLAGGVLAMDIADSRRAATVAVIARRAVVLADAYARACGLPDPALLAETRP